MIAILEEKCDVESAKKVCERIPLKSDNFPSIREINETIHWVLLEKPRAKVKKEDDWVSTQAPGTPACLEALFLMIKHGETECGAFLYGKKYVGLNDKDLFDAYELWDAGKVYEKTRNLAGIPFFAKFHDPSKGRVLVNFRKVG